MGVIVNKRLHLSLVVFVSSIFGCSSGGGSGAGSPDSVSPLPSDTLAVLAAAGCTVAQISNGLTLTCNGTSANLYNGTSSGGGSGSSSNGLTTTDKNGVKYPNLKLVATTKTSYSFWSSGDNALITYTTDYGKILTVPYIYREFANCTGRQFIDYNYRQTQIQILSAYTYGTSPSLDINRCKKTKGLNTSVAYQSYDNFSGSAATCNNSSGTISQADELVDCTYSSDTPTTLAMPLTFN